MAHGGEGQSRPQAPGERPGPGQGPSSKGVCDVALANTYYVGKMATNEKKSEQKDWAGAIRVQFLDQDGPGQHVNISGAAVIKGAKNRGDAIRLIEFLSGDIAQQMYASSNFEYPVKAGGGDGPPHRVVWESSGPTRFR